MKLFFTPEATEALRRHVTVHDEIAVVIDGEPVLHVLVMDDLGSEEVISGDFARSEIDAWITGFRELRRKRQNARRT